LAARSDAAPELLAAAPAVVAEPELWEPEMLGSEKLEPEELAVELPEADTEAGAVAEEVAMAVEVEALDSELVVVTVVFGVVVVVLVAVVEGAVFAVAVVLPPPLLFPPS